MIKPKDSPSPRRASANPENKKIQAATKVDVDVDGEEDFLMLTKDIV